MSQGYFPEILLAYFDFSELEDIYGNHMPHFDYTSLEIPPQMEPGTMADTLDTSGKVMSSATASVAASSGMMNLLFSGSLSMIWGMINSLQMVVHIPLFG